MKCSILTSALLMAANSAFADPLVYDTWQTEDESARIEISLCEDATPCGFISWINPESPSISDRNNPDSDLRDRSLVGVPMLWGFNRKRERWVNGRIYNPKDGKTYRSHLSISSDGKLSVKGCIGPICKTQDWTKVEAGL